ncbi:MAG TPA: FAD-dependent oxidoreductase [Thermoleophilaceae bacterium]|nr:FAD-dependent oxidoreductase [Thermoleophilaceae bacterium]
MSAEPFRVVICGGGIAAIEGLLRVRRLAGDALDVTVVAPNAELRYRPLAVDEPFSRRGVRTYPVAAIARRTGAEWVQDALEWLDPDAQVVHTPSGASLSYDALLLAVGARSVRPFEHVTVFDDEHADDAYRGLVQDIEGGYTRSVAIVIPEGPTWLLPAYELALMTAERAGSMGEEGLAVSVVTPEAAPLAVLGEGASSAVAKLLADARVQVHANARPSVPRSRRLLVTPDGPELEVERIVAMPRLEGRPVRNVPTVAGGFVPVDGLCQVRDLGPRVFAAGDMTDFPVKHGGLGSQMADTAAAGIAALAGQAPAPEPVRPVIRGVLHTGSAPLYLTARSFDGRIESEATNEPEWPEDEKVVAEELGRFLDSLT